MKKSIQLVTNHDFLSIRTPNGNYTWGRTGSKSTGLLMKCHQQLDRFIQDCCNVQMSMGDAFAKLAKPETLGKFCPDWNKPVPVFKVGEFVKVIDPKFTEKYPLQGRVTEVKKKYIFIQFPLVDHTVGMEPQWLEVVSNEKPTAKSEENPVNPRISKDEIARLKQLAVDSTPSPNPTSRLDQVKAAIAAGYTGPVAIAKFTGIHPSYVSTLLKKV